MEVNPYQSPRESDPLKKKQPAKRMVGVATILLLTPLAVLIAAAASCTAAFILMDRPLGGGSDPAITVGLIVCLGPPVLVLSAMIWWAVRASK